MSAAEGDLAIDAAGKIMPLPHDLTHWLNGELLDVLALIYAAQRDDGESDGGLTDGRSRTGALLSMAREKLREAISDISPYV